MDKAFVKQLALDMGIAFAVFFATSFVGTEAVDDWQAWAVAAALGAARSAASVLIARLTTR